MLVKDQKKFEDIILQLKILTSDQLKSAKAESEEKRKSLEDFLLDKKLISEEDIVRIKALSSGIPYINLSGKAIEPGVFKIVNKEYCTNHLVAPFEISGGQIKVAMLDPYDVQVIDFIEKKTGLMIIPYIASKKSIQYAISQFQDYQVEVTEALKSIEGAPEGKEGVKKAPEVEKIVQDAPITRAVDTILEYAIKSRASDIHIEPRDKIVKVRYRIDGILQNIMTLPKHIHSALITRLKILSDLRIDEHRVPQDGRFQIVMENREVDLRVSISPIIYGEKIVLRLLDKSATLITLENLGLKGNAFKLIGESSEKPWGMILSTGPTSSGKSTTLYAILNKVNSPEINIITLEDPVEYNIEGINQIQINTKVGLTFASGLRSVLRQDPDIIMVGEIRDKETADLAIQAALTGHVVLSTLHTNTAAGVLPRLLDMDVETFLISSTVNAVIGQRLARRICLKCRQAYEASQSEVESIINTIGNLLSKRGGSDSAEKLGYLGYEKLPFADSKSFTLYKGAGCPYCRNTGYSGRIGVFEVFKMTERMGKLLVSNATMDDIQRTAEEEGMVTMKQDGYLKALVGVTTLKEVLRVARD